MNNQRANSFVGPVCALICFLLFGCSSTIQRSAFESQIITFDAGAGVKQVASVPLDFQHIIQYGAKSCSMVNPRMLLGTSSGLSIGDGTQSVGDNTDVAGTFAPDSTTGQAEKLDRALFRLCEMGLNYDITKEQYLRAFYQVIKAAGEENDQNQ